MKTDDRKSKDYESGWCEGFYSDNLKCSNENLDYKKGWIDGRRDINQAEEDAAIERIWGN